MYKNLRLNMSELAPLAMGDMNTLVRMLGEMVVHCLWLQACGANGCSSSHGIRPSGCLALDVLVRADDAEFHLLGHHCMHTGCHCFEASDIDTKDT